MRANFVVMAAPALDDRLGLRPRPEPFETQALVAELAVEAFGDAILPRLAGLDQRRIDALRNDPGQERLRHELRAVGLHAVLCGAIGGEWRMAGSVGSRRGVNSSVTVRHLSCWPLAQWSNTKS